MRALNVLLSVLISLLLAVGILEVGLRLFPQYRPKATINRFDPVLGWAKKADAEVRRRTDELDVTFRTNADGLRDDPIQRPKPEGTFRVVMLGDSFVLGYTVDREDLFVDLCEGWWRSEGRRVEVVNAGTEGYSTDQEVAWFLEHGAGYEPDLVLLFPYDNDLYWNGQERYQSFPKPRFRPDGTLEERVLEDPGPPPWWKRTALGNVRRPRSSPEHAFQVEGVARPLYRELAPLLVDPPEPVRSQLEDAVARTRGALQALKRRCDELGAKLVLAPIPSEAAIHAAEREKLQERSLGGLAATRWSPDRPVDLFLALGRELGIRTLDPRPALRAHDAAGERLYFENEWHFDPHGNRRFAEFLVAELDRAGAFPAEHAPTALGSFTPETVAEDGGIPTWLLVFAGLWAVLGFAYGRTYRDEPAGLAFLKVGGLLAVIFAIVLGGGALLALVPTRWATVLLVLFVAGVLGFVAVKLGRRLGTIAELLKAFTLRGHWYLMPLVVVLLTIGSLLVVAASSPLIAPFIYTLF